MTRMDAADRKANEVRDLLYVQGVRTNEHVHLTVYPIVNREVVMVSIGPNHYDCEDCRSKSLGAKILEGLKRGIRPTCTQCRIHMETMEHEQRGLFSRAAEALRHTCSITDEYVGYTMASLEVAV